MNNLSETICRKRWQAYVLLLFSGVAVGMLLSKIVSTVVGG